MRSKHLQIQSFNLNLLECKFGKSCIICIEVNSFNLNLLECKCNEILSRLSLRLVLISTYWNVNTEQEIKEFEEKWVLISTYWNVNKTKDYQMKGIL